PAQTQKKSKKFKAAEERVTKASEVMTEIMKVAENSIPKDILNKSNALVFFPGSLKVAFIFGGQTAKGVAIRRLGNGWSAPAFFNLSGGSFGLQIGGQKTDYVLVIMNEKGLKNLVSDKFEIGGEGSAAAGPVGRTAAASTNATMDAEILTYSRSKGLFAGVSLKGLVMSQDNDINREVYKKTAREVLVEEPIKSASAPPTLRLLATTVSRYTK
ncbi:MAG TPA: hypothetical protein DEA22_07380, partial [Blastocatellia bacterium]|nr:hypothetical protein [Blastocatellia bacterium]